MKYVEGPDLSPEEVPPVHPLRYYIDHLNESMYASPAEVRQAARQLRQGAIDDRKAVLGRNHAKAREARHQQQEWQRWLDGRQLHSKAERRAAVRDGRGRWCSGALGIGGCHNTGVIKGRNGTLMKCGRCHGEGVRLYRRGRRSKARGKAWRP